MHTATRFLQSVSTCLLVLTCLVLLAGLTAGCGAEPNPAVNPQDVLMAALEPMKQLKSFHFTYAITKPQGAKPSQGTEIVGIVADISMEGLMKAIVDVNQSGVPLQFQFVAAGDTHYVQNPISGQWQAVPADSSPLGRINLSSGAIRILEHIRNAQYAGKEAVGGTECHKIKGVVAAAEIAGIVAAANAEGDVACVLWIGSNDHLIRRIQLTGAAQQGEDPRLVRTMELSRFGEPVEIEVPS